MHALHEAISWGYGHLKTQGTQQDMLLSSLTKFTAANHVLHSVFLKAVRFLATWAFLKTGLQHGTLLPREKVWETDKIVRSIFLKKYEIMHCQRGNKILTQKPDPKMGALVFRIWSLNWQALTICYWSHRPTLVWWEGQLQKGVNTRRGGTLGRALEGCCHRESLKKWSFCLAANPHHGRE